MHHTTSSFLSGPQPAPASTTEGRSLRLIGAVAPSAGRSPAAAPAPGSEDTVTRSDPPGCDGGGLEKVSWVIQGFRGAPVRWLVEQLRRLQPSWRTF